MTFGSELRWSVWRGWTCAVPQLKLALFRKISLITSYPIKRQKEFDWLPGSDSVRLHSHSNSPAATGVKRAIEPLTMPLPPLRSLMVTAGENPAEALTVAAPQLADRNKPCASIWLLSNGPV